MCKYLLIDNVYLAKSKCVPMLRVSPSSLKLWVPSALSSAPSLVSVADQTWELTQTVNIKHSEPRTEGFTQIVIMNYG